VKLRFANFVLDRDAGRLLGPEGEVRLRPQAFRMLEVLAEEAPKILSQEELQDRVWGVEHLSPASVKQAVSEVRQALGDDPVRPVLIETVHRRGYRFIAAVERITDPPPARKSELATQPISTPGETLRSRPSGRRLSAAFTVPILAGLSALALVQRPLPELSRPVGAAPAQVSSRPAVAILGFKNLAADPAHDWISGALAEIIGFELAAPGRLRLIPGENIARMRRELIMGSAESHSPRSLARIGRNLGTDLTVTGSYLRTDDAGEESLRIQVLVQDVRTGETVAWARETGRQAELIDLAAAAARGIHESVGGARGGPQSEAAAFLTNTASLRLYSEALSRLRVWDAPAALPLLERAAALDPGSAFPQDALAAAYARLGFDLQAREAAQRALELSRDLPRGVRLGIEGRSREIRGEWDQAVDIYLTLRRFHPDDVEIGLRLAAAQESAGHAGRALETIADLRRLAPPAGDDPRLDLAEADAAWRLSDFARSRDAATRAIAGAEGRGATLLVAEGRFNRGWALDRLGKADGALADHRAARILYIRMGDRAAAAAAQMAAAGVLRSSARPAEARLAYEEAIAVLREIGDRSREAKALNNYAAMLSDQGDLSGMQALLERSLAIKLEVGDRAGAATTLGNLGNVLRQRDRIPEARERLEEALKIQRELKNDSGTAFALRGLAGLHRRENRLREALAALEEALALSRKTGDVESAADTLLSLGDLSRKAKRPEKAREHYQQALEEFQRLGQANNMVYPLLNLGGLDEEQQRFAAARARYDRALALAASTDNEFLQAHARSGLAETAERLGDLNRARNERRKALALWTKVGDDEEAAKARAALARLGAASG
jgi:DNA-binding winged helix-turn-helix (wHTH) protein/tetratricopeptide (TPR) repeat protein